MEEAAQLAESIVQATAVTHDPTAPPQRRAEAVQFFEQLKQGEIHRTVYAAAVLTGTEYPLEVQMSAYTLLQILVRNRWAELSQDEHQKVTQLAYQHMKDVGHLGQQAAWPLKSKAAMLLAAVTRQQGPETYAALLPQLINSAAEGPMQAEISCMVLQFVSEDITQFEERGGEWKRNYLSALLASVERVLPFIVKLLQDSFQAGSSAAAAGAGDAARAHAAVVSAALGTLGGYVEWAPMGRLCSGSVVEACSFFLGVPDFREAALAVVKSIVMRKAGKDAGEAEALAATQAKVADALTAAAAALLATPNAQQELDLEGANEEYGRRLCGVVASFTDNHWAHVGSVAKQHQLLAHMLEFVRHPHLPLCTAALSFWSSLAREAGAYPVPSKQSPLHSPRDGAAAAAAAAQQQQQQQQQQPGPLHGSGGSGDRSQLIPPECCQMLVQALAEQLVRMPVRFEEADVPLWADSAEEYKSAVGGFRSQAKMVLRSAARLAPMHVLNSVTSLQAACLQAATSANNAAVSAPAGPPSPELQRQLVQGHMALEAAVLLVESVLPSLCDPAVLAQHSPGLKAGLDGLLGPLMALRFRDPLLVTLHARALEAFSKFIPHAPEQLVPLLSASFEGMSAVPLEQSGQLPPPAKVSLRWKEEAMARLSMAKVLLNVAKETPNSFPAHLQGLVTRVEQLWAAGQLREGEKVALHEGLMAAVSKSDAQLQAQLLQWLLRPVHTKWSNPSWLGHLESPAAFAAEYMQYEVPQGGGPVVVGSSPQRWCLHHELQLFERILRRTPPPPVPAGDGQQQQQQQQQALLPPGAPGQAARPQHPFVAHMEWSLVPVAAIIRSLHGVFTPEMQAQLAPLAAAFSMDPVEKALRVGGQREEAKKTEEDAGTIAGTNAPALRYWLRSIREGAYMITSYSCQHLGTPFWYNQGLAGIIPQALATHVEHMEDRHLRILLRHGLMPLLVHCPPAVRPPWLLPVLSKLLPLMHQRLSSSWAAIAAGQGAAAPGGGPAAAPQGGGQEQAQQQLSDEVVGETLLREVTREYLLLLTKAADRAVPGSAAGGSGSGGGSAGNAASAAAAAAIAGPPAPGVAAPAGHAEQASVIESLWGYDEQAMRCLMATAIAAMCWPDAAAAGKATLVCRFVATLAETSHPELELQVLPEMLRSAMLSVVQVSSITIQPEVLHLLRQLLVTWLPRSQPIRDMVLQLPHITPQVLASFQEQLLALNSDKDQRGLIKTLLAEAGGEQARAVLSAVGKVAAPVTNLPEPKAKPGSAMRPEDEVRWDWSEAGIAL